MPSPGHFYGWIPSSLLLFRNVQITRYMLKPPLFPVRKPSMEGTCPPAGADIEHTEKMNYNKTQMT